VVQPEFYCFLDLMRASKIEAEGCHCSVLGECTDLKLRPRIVKACEPIPDNQRWQTLPAMAWGKFSWLAKNRHL